MKKLPLFLGLLASTLVLASCEKDVTELPAPAQEVAVPTQSKLAMLEAGPWHLTSLLLASAPSAPGAAPTVVDILPRLKAAQRDNLHSFSSDGSFVLDEAAVKAYPEAPQQLTGAWQLAGDSLTVSQSDITRHYLVEELTATTLRVKLTQTDGQGTTTYTSVFAR